MNLTLIRVLYHFNDIIDPIVVKIYNIILSIVAQSFAMQSFDADAYEMIVDKSIIDLYEIQRDSNTTPEKQKIAVEIVKKLRVKLFETFQFPFPESEDMMNSYVKELEDGEKPRQNIYITFDSVSNGLRSIGSINKFVHEFDQIDRIDRIVSDESGVSV
jgi:hypothetical protein